MGTSGRRYWWGHQEEQNDGAFQERTRAWGRASHEPRHGFSSGVKSFCKMVTTGDRPTKDKVAALRTRTPLTPVDSVWEQAQKSPEANALVQAKKRKSWMLAGNVTSTMVSKYKR